MTQEKKRNRTCRKYHYDTITICRETDVIFTRCRVCKELFPSTLEYFRKDKSPDAKRLIQPLCRKCSREINAEKRIQKQNEIKEKKIENVSEQSLFDVDDNESVESKLDRIMKYLGLKK